MPITISKEEHKMSFEQLMSIYNKAEVMFLKIHEQAYILLKSEDKGAKKFVSVDKTYNVDEVNYLVRMINYYRKEDAKIVYILPEMYKNSMEEVETFLFTVKMLGE